MTKKIKWACTVVAAPFILFATLALLFYFPPFQNWAVKQVASYASDKTGMPISVAHVNLEFPLDLGIEGVRVIQPNDSLPQVRDTVADVRKLIADVQLWPLLHQQVEIDELAIEDMRLNTADFVHEARVKGHIGRLDLRAHGIDLAAQTLKVDVVHLKDAVLSVAMSDTVPKDTTKSENHWKIEVGKVSVMRTALTVDLPGDTLRLKAYLGETVVENGRFDLFKASYEVKKFDLTEGRFQYDNRLKARTKGLDPNHVALSEVAVGIDSLGYVSEKLSLRLRRLAFKEQSGLQLTALKGVVEMDTTRLRLPDLYLKTPHSALQARVDLPFDAFAAQRPGILRVWLNATLGKQDLLPFMATLPPAFRRQWPTWGLTVSGLLRGNLQRLRFTNLAVSLPTVGSLYANGFLSHLDKPARLEGDVTLYARTSYIGFATTMLPRQQQ